MAALVIEFIIQAVGIQDITGIWEPLRKDLSLIHIYPKLNDIIKAIQDHVDYALETLAACEKKYK